MKAHAPSTGHAAPEDDANGTDANGTADADADAFQDPLVDECLRLSTFIFDEMNRRLKEQKTTDRTIRIERTDTKAIKKASLAINRAFTKYVKKAHEREDRLLIELHLIRQASQRDGVDRDANRARVYEYLRRYRTDSDDAPTALPTGVQGNPLTAPSAGAAQVDRAMAAVARIESAIAQLSPTGALNVHGTGLLTAATR